MRTKVLIQSCYTHMFYVCFNQMCHEIQVKLLKNSPMEQRMEMSKMCKNLTSTSTELLSCAMPMPQLKTN